MKQYLEKLQSSQTFYKNSVGNSKVAKSGHVYAKVKFGDFTKEPTTTGARRAAARRTTTRRAARRTAWF